MVKYILPLVVLSLALLSGACEKKDTPKGDETTQSTPSKSIIPKGKYALLVVESKSCIYCAQLKKDLKTEEKLKEALKGMELYTLLYESYEPVRSNIGGELTELPEKELAKKLNATSFPTLIFYDKEGNVIVRIPGYLPPDKLACVINYVKTEKFKEMKLRDYMKECA
ncbi:MAG: thioredoxin fold domain-containing protein [Aquificae bacterium]|nr:thioredoxin fold domain-containing protein [Aquificota bacterium]